MMSDIPQTGYIPLQATLQDVVTAHDKLRQGIATHAEKEHERRLEARRQLEAQDKLQGK